MAFRGAFRRPVTLSLLVVVVAVVPDAATVTRRVRVDGERFVLSSTGEPVVLSGPNVVVKGPPYLPEVAGTTICNDVVNSACEKNGTCTSCATFNAADAAHIKRMGWNAIRLGVVWAGAQPRDGDALDAEFVRRLHAVLDLCDREGLHVLLDNHGDMVGSAGCGNGVPMWIQRAAAPNLIGAPLRTDLPWSLSPKGRVSGLSGYHVCGDNATKWAAHAGDPNYNLLNECCAALNDGNPIQLGLSTVSQATMDYIVAPGAGREAFVHYWRLIAQVAARHPSAIGAELMNEPITWRRREAFDTWRAAAEAINEEVPDMAVALADFSEGAFVPSWLVEVAGAGVAIDRDTVEWIRRSTTLFYAWHYYGDVPILERDVGAAIKNVQALSADWQLPSFATEFMGCSVWRATAAANISHSYWHYSAYCTTGPSFGDRTVPTDTFGACILGWAGGTSHYKCTEEASAD